MFSRLPLTALRAFESAARLGSFKAAATELSVTPTAISHQVKTLETWLGLLLFERKPLGVTLTPSGQRLHAASHAALRQLSDALEAIQPVVPGETLVLTTTPSFAAAWLIPRLDGFHERFPHLHVAVETSDAIVDLERESRVDLAIRCSTGSYPSLMRQALFDEYFGAFASPDFDADNDDGRLNLIAVRWDTPTPNTVSATWQAWCEQAGKQDWLRRSVFRHYDDEHYALQAVLHGRGAVLASSVLVNDQVMTGALRPILPSVRLPGDRYVALCRPGRERTTPIREFLLWLDEEASNTRAALDGIRLE